MTRNSTKLIRFNADELQLVAERARAAGRPIACFIRESSLGSAPRARKTDVNDTLVRVLARVATRLTELSALASDQKLPRASEFGQAVAEVLGIIRNLD